MSFVTNKMALIYKKLRFRSVEHVAKNSLPAEDDTPEISPKPEPESIASPTRSAFSEEERQPRPAPAKPQIQTFGEDPTTFDDPTTYHIREIHENLTEEEKKEIFGVKEYPHDDLHKQTPGTPPDRDFSNAKPSNQVSFAQFSNYVEPYIRPLAVEDISVLDERGDRSSPFVIPRRGGKHYQQIWDEEDSIAAPSSSNRSHIPQPSGSMDQMNDEAAEKGTISVGPVMARLTSAMIPERRAPTAETSVNGVNGDSGNNASTNGEAEGSIDANGEAPGARPLAPATHMPESNQPGWKANPPKMDYGSLDQRALQELRHIGFIEEEAQPDYDEHYDDEIAARLRYLQGELRLMSLVNGARKRRVKELALEALAKQEYNTIADDLDNQINQSYLKRHRNYGKNKKVSKRPGATTGGQVGGSGVSKASLGEQIKSLLDRRQEWKRVVGPIVEYGSLGLPEDTIFDKASMTKHFAAELELWVEQTGEQA